MPKEQEKQEEYRSYSCYLRLSPRHKWKYQSVYNTAELNKIIEFLQAALGYYTQHGKRAAYALILNRGVSSLWQRSLWHKELLEIPEDERWIIDAEAD